MAKIITDYEPRTWKFQAELFKMGKPFRSSFNSWASFDQKFRFEFLAVLLAQETTFSRMFGKKLKTTLRGMLRFLNTPYLKFQFVQFFSRELCSISFSSRDFWAIGLKGSRFRNSTTFGFSENFCKTFLYHLHCFVSLEFLCQLYGKRLVSESFASSKKVFPMPQFLWVMIVSIRNFLFLPSENGWRRGLMV